MRLGRFFFSTFFFLTVTDWRIKMRMNNFAWTMLVCSDIFLKLWFWYVSIAWIDSSRNTKFTSIFYYFSGKIYFWAPFYSVRQSIFACVCVCVCASRSRFLQNDFLKLPAYVSAWEKQKRTKIVNVDYFTWMTRRIHCGQNVHSRLCPDYVFQGKHLWGRF